MNKKYFFLIAVFLLCIVSFFCEWIPAQNISFVSYSYFLLALYLARCYVFCVAILSCLSLCGINVGLGLEAAVFAPVLCGGIFILLGFSFNAMMFYSRIVTVFQCAALAAIIVRAALLYERQKNIAAQSVLQTAPDFSKLSKREKEVAALLLQGKTNDEIAAALFVSTATVKSHVQHIFEKYNARNRMEFAAKMH